MLVLENILPEDPARGNGTLTGDGNHDLEAAAYDYLDRGLSFIPLIGKEPVLSRWRRYQKHRPTKRTIKQWLKKYPEMTGWGIPLPDGEEVDAGQEREVSDNDASCNGSHQAPATEAPISRQTCSESQPRPNASDPVCALDADNEGAVKTGQRVRVLRFGWPTKVVTKMSSIANLPSEVDTSPLLALGYTRQGHYWPVAAQRMAISSFCQGKKLRLARLYQDDLNTARTPFLSRPAAQQLWSGLQKRSYLVIAEISLAFCTPANCLEIIRSLQARGVSLHAAHGPNCKPLDLTAVPAELTAKFLERLRGLDHQRRNETMRAALLKLKRQGQRYTNYPGYGYRWVKRGGRQMRVPDPHEQEVIAWLKHWRLKGYSLDRLYFGLLENRVKQRNGKPWSRTRIHRVLRRVLFGK
jgi:hypothetical protein